MSIRDSDPGELSRKATALQCGWKLTLELLTQSYGKKAGTLWARSPLPDRIDAIIAHEISEADHATHESALKAAPQTEMPITHRAREILRAMERGWKGR